ncbi:hypothetical protein MFLAVUS_001749 [Mucor flavus]|uniref:Myb-like, SWIRM and MPN domain-containing protein 1 n=1 Tax=Mucor flavus TaxID=439312 RepID=A0ABP9YNB8_9FUNG
MDPDEELIDIGSDEEKNSSNTTTTPKIKPSVVNDDWNDNNMDIESRKLIEQMLAEEEYYYQQDSLPNSSKKRKDAIIDSDYSFLPNDSFKKTKKEGVISSSSLPSHKTRWNSEEDDLLREALEKFGYGNWKAISEYIKTRNPLQCKNHARHLMQTEAVTTKPETEQDIPVTLSQEEEEEPPRPQTEMKQEIKQELKQVERAEVKISEQVKPSQPVKKSEPVEIKPVEPKVHLPPHQNPLFDRHQVSEEEMVHNPEWFKQKYSKTPDRYLKIRNHMLDCWHQCKPKYLTKTSARKGLKDCGDVNAIGRVHQYLESVGAINVDCTTHAPRPPKRVPREVYEQDDPEEFDASEFVVGYDGPRKRKVRNERGDWVDPKELEGRVIEHGQVVVQLDVKPKRVIKKSNQYYGGDDFGRGYDPFRLVPTNHYNDDLPAPFEVEILSDALLVMDFHSHLAHTEIIGLLGGNFITRGETKVLQVKSVFPCQSTSTGIQCEMDPASEMKAREVFADKGFDVVGWYHSHPTFEPHPSIRDIENQTSYQTLFRKEDTGDEPFIGVIVTPYDPEILSDHSQIQYLHISKEWNELHSFRVPYACRRTVLQSEQVSSEIFNQLVDLIQEYKDYEHKVNMLLPFSSQTRLEKLLDSLKAHLFLRQQDEETFIQSVKDLVLENFVPKEEEPIQDSTQ